MIPAPAAPHRRRAAKRFVGATRQQSEERRGRSAPHSSPRIGLPTGGFRSCAGHVAAPERVAAAMDELYAYSELNGALGALLCFPTGAAEPRVSWRRSTETCRSAARGGGRPTRSDRLHRDHTPRYDGNLGYIRSRSRNLVGCFVRPLPLPSRTTTSVPGRARSLPVAVPAWRDAPRSTPKPPAAVVAGNTETSSPHRRRRVSPH